MGGKVEQWFTRPSHSKVISSIPSLGPFCLFACSSCICVVTLQAPPTARKHACEANWRLYIVPRCECVCLYM